MKGVKRAKFISNTHFHYMQLMVGGCTDAAPIEAQVMLSSASDVFALVLHIAYANADTCVALVVSIADALPSNPLVLVQGTANFGWPTLASNFHISVKVTIHPTEYSNTAPSHGDHSQENIAGFQLQTASGQKFALGTFPSIHCET